MGAVRRVVGVVLALAVCAGGVALAVVAVPLASYEQRGIEVDAIDDSVVSVTTREIDLASSATVSAVWSSERRVRLPAVTGLVTALTASPGVEVDCGTEVLRVDGRPMLAYCGPGPLFREVSAQTRGTDAAEFVQFLQRIELLSPGDVTSDQLNEVIRDMQTSVGWTVDGTVSPGDLVWIEAPFVPSGVLVEPGMTVEAAHDVLLVEPELVSATVTISDGARPAESQSDMVFSLDGSNASYPVRSGGVIADLDGLEGELRSRPIDGGLPATALGSVRLAVPLPALTVPATAVVSGPTGECVQVRDADGDRAVSVSVIGSSIGVVFVDGDIANGDEVVVAPDAGAAQC